MERKKESRLRKIIDKFDNTKEGNVWDEYLVMRAIGAGIDFAGDSYSVIYNSRFGKTCRDFCYAFSRCFG